MGPFNHLVSVVIDATLGAGGAQASGMLQAWIEDPAGRLPSALVGAAQDTRQALELALRRPAGEAPGWLARLAIGAERRALADAIAGLLEGRPLNLPNPDQAKAALAELRSEPGQALLALDPAEIGRGRLQEMSRYAGPGTLIDAARAAMAALADGLERDCPNLAAILRAQPEDQAPLPVLVYGYCLRRRIEQDPELARGLQLQRLDDLAARLGGIDRASGEANTLLAEIRDLLARHLDQPGPVDPRHTRSIQDPREVREIDAVLARTLALPAAERLAEPELSDGAGKLAMGIGDFERAQALFSESAGGGARSARELRDTAERCHEGGEAHFNAYQAALGAEAWDAALGHLRRAAELDAERFAPFSFHDYSPERVLGAGGFGAAFLCRDPLGELHVIKTMHARGAGAPGAALDEGRVERVGYAWQDQRPYLVMEYFAGCEGLDRHLETRGCLTPARVRELGLALASALAYAHAQGVLHRDLKPANVLIRERGGFQVKLIDFGLAAELGGEPRAPSPRTVIGTHDFSAPEARGRLPGVPVDARSDIYSLGATLSWCLCLESRPGREHWAALERQDPGLADILARCLKRDPRERWESAQALHDALSGAVRPDPGSARRAGARGRSVWAWAGGVVTLAVAVLAVVLLENWGEPAAPPQPGPPSASVQPTPVPPLPDDPPAASEPKTAAEVRPRLDFEPEMVPIPAGRFQMGSPDDEPERNENEGPRHWVQVPAFEIGKTEVTFDQWDACFADGGCKHNPDDAGWGRGDRPVIDVSWDDIQEYLAWLNSRTGKGYRLPSEAEWEYAARAGTKTPFWTGDCITTEQANYDGNYDYNGCGAKTGIYRRQTVPVSSLPANPWGLHEVAGNVYEWVADCWHSSYEGAPSDGSAWTGADGADCRGRVLRGGHWSSGAGWCRSAYRGADGPGYRDGAIGLRLARGSSPGSGQAWPAGNAGGEGEARVVAGRR